MNAYYICDNCGPRLFNKIGDSKCKTCGEYMYLENDEHNIGRDREHVFSNTQDACWGGDDDSISHTADCDEDLS
jgi:uncharacterized Zn finger protein (UPF0148 family)